MASTRTGTLAELKAAIDKLEDELHQAQTAHERVLRELAAVQETALRAQDDRTSAGVHRGAALAAERLSPSVATSKAARDAAAALEAADREVSSQGEAVKGLQEVAAALSEELERRRVAIREEATHAKARAAEALVSELEVMWRKEIRPLLGQIASIHAVSVRNGTCPPVVSAVDAATFAFENQLFHQSRFKGYDSSGELKAERAAALKNLGLAG